MTLIPEPCIPDFYAGKNILITGATGFLGKALIEKLLRSCPKVGLLYILMRPKKGKQLHERLKVLIDDQLYERVKQEQSNLKMEEKIIPLAGDVTQLNLGLSPSDRQTLVDNVHVTFHVAASVRFDDPLTDAVIMNIRGTREACQLALDAKNLVAHVHVSTAFANCDRSEAKEILYPAKIDWRKMIEIAENFDKNKLNALTQVIMDGMPNTYCFTKNIAEHAVHDMMSGKKPCKIFRPSIVISALRDEPVAGWIDNFNGPVGILVAYGKGILRTSYTHGKYKPDYIPVDVVTKALLISAWDLAVRHEIDPQVSSAPEIIHCTSHNTSDGLRTNVEILTTQVIKINEDIPLNDILWIPSTHTTTSKAVWYIRTVFFMLIPALFVDALCKVLGKKAILTKLQIRMFVAQIALRHFMTNEWIYPNDNLLALQDRIQENDKADWDYDFRDIDFNKFVRNCILGVRRYLLKEPDSTLPQARKHYKKVVMISRIVNFFGMLLIFWIFWNMGVVDNGFQKTRF